MAKAKKTALQKPGAGKSEDKLAIKGGFADVFKVVKKNKEDKKKIAPNDLEKFQEFDEQELGGEG